jgi:hypothetical protein
MVNVVIYRDFNCPCSYPASQRADRLGQPGVAVDWRAVEHDWRLPVPGSRPDGDRAARDRELTGAASLALPAEAVRAGPRPS